MSEIVGACLSQFHGDEDSFELLLLAFSDGREIGHVQDEALRNAFDRWRKAKTYQEKILLPVYQEAFYAGYKASLPIAAVAGAQMGRTK